MSKMLKSVVVALVLVTLAEAKSQHQKLLDNWRVIGKGGKCMHRFRELEVVSC